ncbi:hypothetical protein Q648_00613 [Bartonella quintana JK 12]|uniref:NTP pyrophosphohydrolase MazG-like domain-containing protein n=1 Tax=Bartonella quintana JK 68 TaxID=1134503 RepID=A0ABR4SRJ5_BARQI|nr:hypothetical protein Q651_01108 [Bartonella quintana BQ2-D70]ETS18080.1 hypothetical protein Q647_01024 [Bartonella quintana JK 7]ETS18909.1 hypothetical protein Q648_00613 [Bartonella quintana JK 12]KEC60102.1 hypothetical protein O93_00239 [Bartonella quintana JK 19]KEC60618.1 hypothetical protein O91_01209 [Bartonella quintana JK 31]KEC61719.1 hypothetical protein O7Y_01022 [Bartonella quintana JK 63]KEC64469.1 hypothetical protein O7W_00861 [Bartonella quintana JK 56]KEC66966.1 hypoth
MIRKCSLVLQKEAAKVRVDWHESHKVFAKIELNDAIKNDKTSDIEEELGNLYFTLFNLARHLNIDSQKALKKTNTKF